MKLILLTTILLLLGCSHSNTHKIQMSKDECDNARKCTTSGMLKMSSDGHAFIGILTLADGSCINVSLPDSTSKDLLGKSESFYEARGFVFPYPTHEDIWGIEVNGRKVGFGLCGPNYVFVK